MSWRVTLVLAIAVFVTAIGAWFDLRRIVPPQMNSKGDLAPVPTEMVVTPLAEFAPEDVVAIRIHRGSLQVQIRREDGRWTGIRQPEAVNDFLTDLHDMSAIMEVSTSQKDLADHGLESVSDSIELLLVHGAPINLSLGNQNPTGTSIYVKVGGNRVVLAGALLRWELDKLTRALTEPASVGGTPRPAS